MSTSRHDKTKKPFTFHGVEFTGDNTTQWIGVCPFCDSAKSKFYVNKDSGLWDCKRCGRSGNIGQFLEHIQSVYRDALTVATKRRFAKRMGVSRAALDVWRPGLSFDGRLTFLIRDRDGRAVDLRCKPLRGKTFSTSECKLGLLGAEELAHAPTDIPVFLAEGESDAIALRAYRDERNWRGVVLAVPGAGIFKSEWASWFAGRRVHVLFDNDDPGRKGEHRVYAALKPVTSELTFLHWPSDTADKYDVRDWLSDGRTWKALRRCFNPEPRLGVPESKQAVVDDAAIAELHRQYVYVVDTDEFIDRHTRRRLKPPMLDRVYAKQFPLGKKSGSNSASQCFWNADGPRVDTTTYRPTAPQSREDFEATDPLTSESDPGTGARLSAVNIYCPSHVQFDAWEMEPSDPAKAPPDARPWLNLGEQLFGGDLAPLLDYMAFSLQHPEQKANWHPWIISEEGAGKDTFFKPFLAAIGDHNVRSVQGKVLRSTFSEWAPETKLVIARDIAKLTEDDWNTLKSFLTHPPDRVLVNRKRIREYWIPNLMHFLFMTNNDDAIELDEQARRLLVLKARAPKRNPEDPDEPYNSDSTNAYVARERVHRAVCRYLLDRPIEPALMRGRAPETAAKQAVVEANESELEHHLRVMRDTAEGPFSRELITADELKAQLRIKLHPEPTWKAIGQALKRARLAVRLSKQARYPKAASHKKVWVWATRYAEFYEQLTDVQLGEEYERQKRKPSFHSTEESRRALLAKRPTLRLVTKRRAR